MINIDFYSSSPFIFIDSNRLYKFLLCFKGTNGGVSIVGLLSSVIGGLVVGVAYYIPLLMRHSETALENGPSQWPVVLVGAMAGFIGSLVDSYLGATLQFSGEFILSIFFSNYNGLFTIT